MDKSQPCRSHLPSLAPIICCCPRLLRRLSPDSASRPLRTCNTTPRRPRLTTSLVSARPTVAIANPADSVIDRNSSCPTKATTAALRLPSRRKFHRVPVERSSSLRFCSALRQDLQLTWAQLLPSAGLPSGPTTPGKKMHMSVSPAAAADEFVDAIPAATSSDRYREGEEGPWLPGYLLGSSLLLFRL